MANPQIKHLAVLTLEEIHLSYITLKLTAGRLHTPQALVA